MACIGLRMPMEKLDGIVLGEVTRRILQPERLQALLEEYLRTAIEREDGNRDQLRRLRQAHKDAEAGIARLLELVERGLMDADDSGLRERLVAVRFRLDEFAKEVAELQRRLATAEPTIRRRKWASSPSFFARRYAMARPNFGRPMPGSFSMR